MSSSPHKDLFADQILANLGDDLNYAHEHRSWSPFYSDIGLGFDEDAGIAHLFLHYNRKTTTLGSPFFTLPQRPCTVKRTALSVQQLFDHASAAYAFYDHNSWMIECTGLDDIQFHLTTTAPIAEARRHVVEEPSLHIFEGYLPTKDPRDPDLSFPLLVGLRLVCGKQISGDGITTPLRFGPDESGRLVLGFSVQVLDISHEILRQRLLAAPSTVEDATNLSREWFRSAAGNLVYHAHDPLEENMLAQAVYILAFNACRAPGFLAGRIAAFPNRGNYPTHFLWDACLAILGLEDMDPQLAEDALLLLTETLRPDGKMAHFVCSTWMRPMDTQPPLVGWAALRIVKQRGNKEFARALLPALLKNMHWWQTQRMSRYGLLFCPTPLETGWDNTPRMDKGPVLAVDMNSYLLLHMRACAELAHIVGDTEIANDLEAQAERFATRLVEVHYNPEENLFQDVLLETGEKLAIKTPASFIPLFVGVPIEEEKARRMIEQVLLDPQRFVGAVPFPCVAYDEETYLPGKWWRGPMWPPVAYFMLEVLRKYGYDHEYQEMAGRLYSVILRDGNFCECFNSQTGAGIGCSQQSWTAALLLHLNKHLQGSRLLLGNQEIAKDLK